MEGSALEAVSILAEEPVLDSDVPRYELQSWRREYGLVAGVTGRGPDRSPFDLGLGSDQPVRQVLDRWSRLRRAIDGFSGVIIARQVHGVNLLVHDAARGFTVFENADGHVTTRVGVLLAVSLADCIPIYVVDPVGRGVALLHSGWKGTAGRIVDQGIERLARLTGGSPARMVVHCGVGICGKCYQVGSEVAGACGRPASGSSFLDLRGVIAEQARASGVQAISVSAHCSAHDRDRFFSHRASGGADGRMVGYLGYPLPAGSGT